MIRLMQNISSVKLRARYLEKFLHEGHYENYWCKEKHQQRWCCCCADSLKNVCNADNGAKWSWAGWSKKLMRRTWMHFLSRVLAHTNPPIHKSTNPQIHKSTSNEKNLMRYRCNGIFHISGKRSKQENKEITVFEQHWDNDHHHLECHLYACDDNDDACPLLN